MELVLGIILAHFDLRKSKLGIYIRNIINNSQSNIIVRVLTKLVHDCLSLTRLGTSS